MTGAAVRSDSVQTPDFSQELASNEHLAYLVAQPPIAFHRVFVDVTGSATAALLLSACIQEQEQHACPLGSWNQASAEEWQHLTGLSRKEQVTARKILRDQGLLEERRAGFSAQFEIRLNYDRLAQRMVTAAKTLGLQSHTNRSIAH
jgi:predicted mannosyl-3-phosphoglycerate phosphatase (HAD superfamily)